MQLDYDDFDWLVSGVDIGVQGVWRVGGEPVGLACFPDVDLFCAALVDDVHGAAGEGDDDTRMFVAVHGERRVGKDQRTPDLDVFVLNQLGPLGLLLGLGQIAWERKAAKSANASAVSAIARFKEIFINISGVAEV